ncbi:MAG: EAL domain-containing protein [Acetatifactor sp.]
MKLDKSGLDNILFEAFDDIGDRRHIYLCNMQTNMSRWSTGAVEYFGLPGEYMENAGEIWAQHVHPEDRQAYVNDIQEIFSGKKSVHHIDYRARNKAGEYVLCTCHGKVLQDKNGIPLFAGTIENHGIFDRVDATTNLYNIYEFSSHMKAYRTEGKRVGILEIGINNFSGVNEVYGYTFGNRVLREFAGQMLDEVRGKGKVFRMDGVRFACCLENATEESIRQVYNTLREIAHHKIIVDGTRVSVTISGGASFYTDIYDEYSIRNSVEYALHRSKHGKHGQLVIYEDRKYQDNYKILECMETIRDCAINGFDGFYLCYQPIVSSQSEKLIGAEALLRWRKEPIGEVSPGTFIPWLENDPCFFELGNWILKTAMTEAKPVIDKYPDFTLNINLAYPQLTNIEFIPHLKEILTETGFAPQNLCLEMTERCRQLETEELQAVVADMKAMGIRVALDDFGTGFSSLNLLCTIPIDTLKIDRQFIMDIQEKPTNQAVVQAVSECAKNLNIKVCTEGIENKEMIAFLKRYPVDSYQGFYYSRPIPMKDFLFKYK